MLKTSHFPTLSRVGYDEAMQHRYGRWTTHPHPGTRYRMADKIPCVCDCGTHREVRRDKLEYGHSTSCGCRQPRRGRTWTPLAETRDTEVTPGAHFGRWTVIGEPQPGKNRKALCRCNCDDKTEKNVSVRDLLTGRSKSCGCLRRDNIHKLNQET